MYITTIYIYTYILRYLVNILPQALHCLPHLLHNGALDGSIPDVRSCHALIEVVCVEVDHNVVAISTLDLCQVVLGQAG